MDVSDRRMQVQLTPEARIASDFSYIRAIFAVVGFVSALERERAEALSGLSSFPAACTAGTGRFLRREMEFPGAKTASLQFPRPEIRGISAETGRGVRGGGACSPVRQLVKLAAPASCEAGAVFADGALRRSLRLIGDFQAGEDPFPALQAEAVALDAHGVAHAHLQLEHEERVFHAVQLDNFLREGAQ